MTPVKHRVWHIGTHGRLPGCSQRGFFWWRDIIKLLNQHKGLASVTLSDGKTVSLWDDLWFGSVPKLQFLELSSFAKNKTPTLLHALDAQDMFSLFHLPLSTKAYWQLASLQSQLACVIPGSKDLWSYIWGTGSKHIHTWKSTEMFTLPLNGDLEKLMSTQAQNLFLVNLQRQTKCQRQVKKAKYALKRLQLCFLYKC